MTNCDPYKTIPSSVLNDFYAGVPQGLVLLPFTFSFLVPLVMCRLPVLGPALPPGFKRRHREDEDEDEGKQVVGPALPPGYKAESSSSEGEDGDVIGPMPSTGEAQSSVALDFERRAKRMKDRLLGRDVSVLCFILFL